MGKGGREGAGLEGEDEPELEVELELLPELEWLLPEADLARLCRPLVLEVVAVADEEDEDVEDTLVADML